MPRNTSFVLSDHFNDFIARAVESGRYASTSDVLRAGLRILEQEEQRLDRLRAEIIKGEESAFTEDFDFDDVLLERTQRIPHETPAPVAQGRDGPARRRQPIKTCRRRPARRSQSSGRRENQMLIGFGKLNYQWLLLIAVVINIISQHLPQVGLWNLRNDDARGDMYPLHTGIAVAVVDSFGVVDFVCMPQKF